MSRAMSRRMRRYSILTLIAVVPIAILCAYVTNLLSPTSPMPRAINAATYKIVETAVIKEDSETIGGGSGAHNVDLSAETRELRERFRREQFPNLQIELFNWGGPRAAELELESDLPDHVRDLLAHLHSQAQAVAIKETRLHHKLGELAALDPELVLVHLVRDPRAVAASMLLGRRRRTDIYPDAETFFTARTGRRLWSSRRISEDLVTRKSSLGLPADILAPRLLACRALSLPLRESSSCQAPPIFC